MDQLVGILDLPADVLGLILDVLTPAELCALRGVCRRFQEPRYQEVFERQKKEWYLAAMHQVNMLTENRYRSGNGSALRYWRDATEEVYEEYGIRFYEYNWHDDEAREAADLLNFPYDEEYED